MLKWARENGCPWDEEDVRVRGGGHLEMLKWRARTTARRGAVRGRARTRCCKWARANGCPWNEHAKAAKGGHLEVLKWARENGCPWDEETCANAAEGGHLEVLSGRARTADHRRRFA